jgi:O-methyltransferase involved in polyketide biosynthesis
LLRTFLGAWSVVIRTVIIDDLIKQEIGEGVDTILNFGADLDTRPYRMDLPKTLRWVEGDYPPVIELKKFASPMNNLAAGSSGSMSISQTGPPGGSSCPI